MSVFAAKRKIVVVCSLVVAFTIAVTFGYSARAQALLQMGATAPDFSLKNLDGRQTGLSDFSRNKTVILVFWSTWSSNSRKALQRFEEFHRKYKDRGLQVIGINAENQTISDGDRVNIAALVKELDITFPVLLDRGLSTFHNYGIVALPSTVIISDGKITYELPGLPLVGTEEMFDHLLVLAGGKPRATAPPKYQPRHDAIADANLAKGFVSRKMGVMAYPLFKRAIEKDPKYMLPYVELARLYFADGDAAQAEETLRKALSVEPDNVVAMAELGYVLCRSGKVKESVEVLGRAAKINTYTPSHYYYAFALGKEGRLKEALTAFDKALELNPFDQTAYLLRGEIYENNNMQKEAAEDYRKAAELLLKIRG